MMEESLPTTLAEALQEVSALRSELRKSKGHVKLLLSDTEKGGVKIAELKMQVTSRDNEIAKLQREINYVGLGLPVHRPKEFETGRSRTSEGTQSSSHLVIDIDCESNGHHSWKSGTVAGARGSTHTTKRTFMSHVQMPKKEKIQRASNTVSKCKSSARGLPVFKMESPRKKPKLHDDGDYALPSKKSEKESPKKISLANYSPSNHSDSSESSTPVPTAAQRQVSDAITTGSPSSRSSSMTSLSPTPEPAADGAAHQRTGIRHKYLNGVKALPVVAHPSTVPIERSVLAKLYGGSTQDLKTRFNKVSGFEYEVLYPNYKFNPLLPSEPGHPGLIYTGRTDLAGDTIYCVFRPVSKSKPAAWEYLGHYLCTQVGDLAAAEFQSLSADIQNNLIDATWSSNRPGYAHMRACIYLRMHGIPTDDNAVDNELTKSQAAINAAKKCRIHKAPKRKKGEPGAETLCVYRTNDHKSPFGLTKEHVRNAIMRGDERIHLILMTCVSYEHAFVQHCMARNSEQERNGKKKMTLKSFTSSPKHQEFVEGSSRAPIQNQRPGRTRNPPRRYLQETDSDESDSDYEE